MDIHRDLMLEFDSLGDNCEFGLVQRRAKAEPLGLFRFSYTPLAHLLRGLSNGFEGMDQGEHIDVYVSPRAGKEIMVRQTLYGMVYHTGVLEGQKSLEEVRNQEIRKLRFLRERIIEDLKVGEKIFVRIGDNTLEKIEPLRKALLNCGPNWLLWVVVAEDSATSGTAEIICDGLIKGQIDRFALDGDAHKFSYDSWIHVCASAYRIWPKSSPSFVQELIERQMGYSPESHISDGAEPF